MADRLNFSSGQSTAFMTAVLAVGGVKFADVTLSVTSTRAARIKVRESVSTEIKSNFVLPKHCTLHWDGKLVPDKNKEKWTDSQYLYPECQTTKKENFWVSPL
jgi:hypothetical protein